MLTHFGRKNQTRKIVTICKDFFNYIKSSSIIFLPQNVLILLVNNIYIGNIRTFLGQKIKQEKK